MPPKSFQKVELAKTIKTDHSEVTKTGTYGEQNTFIATVPYEGSRRTINATVNPAELQRGIAKQKAEFAKTIQANPEYSRVRRGQRVVKHKLPPEESYLEDGEIKVSRPSTTTRRMEH